MKKTKNLKPIDLSVGSGVRGHFALQATKVDGSSTRTLASFENLILDAGLLRVLSYRASGISNPIGVCRVGAGSSDPSPEQEQLDAQVASVGTAGDPMQSIDYGPDPYPVKIIQKFRFPAGAAQGNLSEIGVGWTQGPVGGLFCRALIKDSEGVPTTIEVFSDEFLDVTYTLYVYPDLTDASFTLNLSSGSHDGILRPAELANSASLTPSFMCQPLLGAIDSRRPVMARALDGSLGPVTGTPSGTGPFARLTSAPQAHVPGTFYTDTLLTIAPADGNVPGGIKVLPVSFLSWLSYQISFNPPIPKNQDRRFSIRLRVSLARR